MSHAEELAHALDELEEAYEVARESIEEEMPGVNVYRVRNTDGSYVLLDSLIEIVRARTLLAQIEKI